MNLIMDRFRQHKDLAFQTATPSEVLTDTGPKATPGDYPVEGKDSTGLFIYAEIIFKWI